MKSKIIVAVDPGTVKIGVAILKGFKRKIIGSAQIKHSKRGKEHLERSLELAQKALEFVKEQLGEEKPDIIAIEDQYFHVNAQSSIKVTRMAGIVLGMFKATYPDIKVELVSPRKVSALTGINEKNYHLLGKTYHKAIINYVEKVLRHKVKGEDEAFAILLGMSAREES